MKSTARVSIFGFAFALLLSGAPAAEPDNSVAWLFRPPPDQARVELHLASVDSAGRRKEADLELRYTRTDDERRLAVSLADVKQPVREFCFRCGASGVLERCAGTEDGFPESTDDLIPGTLLPWRVLTTGLCGEFAVRSTEPSADKEQDIVTLAPADAAEGDNSALRRVFVSHATQFPEKIVELDAEGAPRATIEIHQLRRVAWGRAVARSTWIDAKTRARVLIELRSGEVGEAGETDSGKP